MATREAFADTSALYAFTDCTSFVMMRELRLIEALTTDHHFVEAGFRALLPAG